MVPDAFGTVEGLNRAAAGDGVSVGVVDVAVSRKI